MPKQQDNKMIGDRLEKRIWRLMRASAKQLGKPIREIAPGRGIRESLTIDNETGHWAFVWYEANPNEQGSNPDFTITHDSKILLAIEAKNHSPQKHHPNLEWTISKVIRRFQFHDAETKILYIPRLNPTPKDEESVLNALKENRILTIQIGRHSRPGPLCLQLRSERSWITHRSGNRKWKEIARVYDIPIHTMYVYV